MTRRGITFNGKHSFDDMGYTLVGVPKIEFPQKNKYLTRIPFSNVMYDRSEATGFQEYEERRITCEFNVIDKFTMDIIASEQLATDLAQWLDSTIGLQPLHLDTVPYWYFKAGVSEILDWETNHFEFGTIKVVFRAYPFKISIKNEGSPYWDDLTIYDYDQTVKYVLPSLTQTLKPIEVGDMVTIGGWIEGLGVEGMNYNTDYITERYRKVEEILEDGAKYRLEGNFIISHRNILQARTEGVPVTLHNISSHTIKPKIEIVGSKGITIVRKGEIYNIVGETNNKFSLNAGKNEFMIYGQDCTVQFIWQREVL